MLTYLHLIDVDNPSLPKEVYRLLDQPLEVGLILNRYVTEGYIPCEVVRFNLTSEVFESYNLYDVEIKKHPSVKTHCIHEWSSIIDVLQSHRMCKKCDTKQEFNYGKSMWIDI